MAKEAPLLPTTEPKNAPPRAKEQSATDKKEPLLDRIVKNRLSIFFTVCALATAIIPPSCAFFSWASSIPEPYFDATLWSVHGFLISQLPMATWNIASLLSAEDRIPVFSLTRYSLPSAVARIPLVALSAISFLNWYTLLGHNPLHYQLHDASIIAWCFLALVFLPRGRWLLVAKALVHLTVGVFFISLCLKIRYENTCGPVVAEVVNVNAE